MNKFTEFEEIPVGSRNGLIYRIKEFNKIVFSFKKRSGFKTFEERVFKSTDAGISWTDITAEFDLGLGKKIPTTMESVNENYFTNLGEIVNLALNEDGVWKYLPIDSNSEYVGIGKAFCINNYGVILWGGEGMFEGFVELWKGRIDLETNSWIHQPELIHATQLDDVLDNRDISVISRHPITDEFFLGVAGGIIKGNEFGENFRFVKKVSNDHEDEPAGTPFPSIIEFGFSSKDYAQILVCGSDWASDRVYLSWSWDGGETWLDMTDVFEDLVGKGTAITFLEELDNGNFIIGINDIKNELLKVVELNIYSKFEEYFAKAKYTGNGLWFHEKFGWINANKFPWVYLYDFSSWTYFQEDQGKNKWIWEETLGWTWTSEDLYPVIYISNRNSFFYYLPGSVNPRWFFSYKLNDWVAF